MLPSKADLSAIWRLFAQCFFNAHVLARLLLKAACNELDFSNQVVLNRDIWTAQRLSSFTHLLKSILKYKPAT